MVTTVAPPNAPLASSFISAPLTGSANGPSVPVKQSDTLKTASSVNPTELRFSDRVSMVRKFFAENASHIQENVASQWQQFRTQTLPDTQKVFTDGWFENNIVLRAKKITSRILAFSHNVFQKKATPSTAEAVASESKLKTV
jgi:hypothetical protein